MNKAQKIFWIIIGWIIISILIGFINPIFAIGMFIIPCFVVIIGMLVWLIVSLYIFIGDD